LVSRISLHDCMALTEVYQSWLAYIDD